MDAQKGVAQLTAAIVASYVGKNSVAVTELPALIKSVHAALSAAGPDGSGLPPEAPVPAVSIKKSISPDHLICLEEGKSFRSLKRHLATHHKLTPDQYRLRWALPPDYPMVAPLYAETRSALAKQMGLGHRRAGPRRRRGRGV